MLDLVQQLIAGMAAGCVYALVALGFVMVYKTTEVVSLAHGALLMVGAYVTYALVTRAGLPYWLGTLGAVLSVAAWGVLIDRCAIRPLVGRPVYVAVMVTLGLAMAMRGAVLMIPGLGTDTLKVATPLAGSLLRAGPLVLAAETAVVIGFTALLVAAAYVFFARTRLGIAMQAMAQNRLAASYVGIDTARMQSWVWGLSAGVAALAGALLAPLVFVHVNMDVIGLKVLPAAVIGGLGSLPGAVAGGLIVGVAEALAGLYLPEGFKEVAAYVVVLVVLFVRPGGLFGHRQQRRV